MDKKRGKEGGGQWKVREEVRGAEDEKGFGKGRVWRPK